MLVNSIGSYKVNNNYQSQNKKQKSDVGFGIGYNSAGEFRQVIVAANLKLGTQEEKFFENIDGEVNNVVENLASRVKKSLELVVAPANMDLTYARKAIKKSEIKLAAQNFDVPVKNGTPINPFEGAYTGATTSNALLKSGIKSTIINHSEREDYFGETVLNANTKILEALKAEYKDASGEIHKMEQIFVCCGEKSENKGDIKIVTEQIKAMLANVSKEDMKRIVIAYEPKWAIGKEPCTPEIANNMAKAIRDEVKNLYGSEVADDISILYGGSLKPENFAKFLEKEHIDGGLIGGAAKTVEGFWNMCKSAIGALSDFLK